MVRDTPWPLTDLRVDWSTEPIAVLAALWRLWRPQAEAYRLRALDPAAAPAEAQYDWVRVYRRANRTITSP